MPLTPQEEMEMIQLEAQGHSSVAGNDSFLSRVGKSFDTRATNEQRIADRAANGQKTVPEALGEIALSSVGGPINDVAGAALETVSPYVRKAGSYLPGIDKYDKGIQTISGAAGDIYSNIPERARDIVDAAGNAASLLIPSGKAAEVTTSAIKTNRLKKISENILPDISTTSGMQAAQEGGGVATKKTLIGKGNLYPVASKAEEESIGHVANIKGYNPKDLYQTNANKVYGEIEKEAESFKKLLKNNDIDLAVSDPYLPHGMNKFSSVLDNVVDEISKQETLRGDSNRIASNMARRVHELIAKHPQNLSGLLEVRKEFDAMVKKESGGFPKDGTAMGEANQKVRNAINDFIDQNAPTAEMKTSMRKQSALFRARDVLEGKAAKGVTGAQAPTRGARAKKTINKLLTGKAAAGAAGAAVTGAGAYIYNK